MTAREMFEQLGYEQLENIRKEVIEYVLKNKLYRFKYDDEELFEITTDKKAKDDLLNILSKGDIFENIETEEKAFKFKDYIKDLQQKVEQLENIRKEAVEYIKEDMYGEPNELYGLVDGEHLLNILNKGSE